MAKKLAQLVVVWTGLMSAEFCWAEILPDSEVWLYYSQDEFQARQYMTSLSLAISEDDMIFINLGYTESEFLSEQITSKQVTLGLSSFISASTAIDISYDYWGNRGELEIDTFGIGVMYFAEDWSFGMPFEYQNIEFYARETFRTQRRFNVDGYGLGFNFDVGGDHLSWSLDGMWYVYSEDLQKLTFAQYLFILGAKNLNQATVLNDWSLSSSLRYRWVDTVVALIAMRSESAIDQAELNYIAINLALEVSESVSLFAEVGRGFERFDLSTDYVSVAIGFSF